MAAISKPIQDLVNFSWFLLQLLGKKKNDWANL